MIPMLLYMLHFHPAGILTYCYHCNVSYIHLHIVMHLKSYRDQPKFGFGAETDLKCSFGYGYNTPFHTRFRPEYTAADQNWSELAYGRPMTLNGITYIA